MPLCTIISGLSRIFCSKIKLLYQIYIFSKRVKSTFKSFLFNFKSLLFHYQLVSNNFFYFTYIFWTRGTR